MKIENQIQKLSTLSGNSYWDNNGAYQKEYNELRTNLVPDTDEADSVHGEMLRCIGNLFYDFCNNGNCNVINTETIYETETHTCNECQGDGKFFELNDESEEEEVTCGECGGSGEVEEEEEVGVKLSIDKSYERMIDFLETNLKNKTVVSNLRAFLLDKSNGYSNYKFDDKEMRV